MSDRKMNLYCRKTKQPVVMAIDEACPHCGQIGHGLDYSDLRDLIQRASDAARNYGAGRRMDLAIESNKQALRASEVTHGS